MEAFNKLSTDNDLGVTYREEKEEKSANVVMQFANGPVSYEYNGTKQSDPNFKGNGVPHGKTFLFGISYGDSNPRTGYEKAAVFLPSNPMGDAHTHVSMDVMKVIAVHEMVHACGLDNNDHAKDGLFYSPLSLSDGKLIVPEVGKNQKPMPPLWLDPKTIDTIKKAWTS
jgi:hypothetical protein